MSKITKGVILAGGSGSRLKNLTKDGMVNKHMLPVYDRPMLQWNIEKLVNVNIEEILIISGTHHIGSIIQYFGSGSKYGCQLTYKVQDQAGGIAEALKLTEGFVDDEKFITILGDNIFEDDLNEFIFKNEKSNSTIGLTLYEVDDPERFGVYHDGVIVEKPIDPKSNNIIAGIYCYDGSESFFNSLDQLEYSERGELEVTDLNNLLLSRGDPVIHNLQGCWTDAGTIESLFRAGEISRNKVKKSLDS